jgi:hypothetical protein
MSAVSAASAQQWGSSASSERAPVRVEASAAPTAAVTSSGDRTRLAVASEPVITRGQISSLKSALKLRPEQHPHWSSVEGVLSDLTRASVADVTIKLRRLKVLAGPLIKSLDDSQRSEAIAFARRIGYAQLASSF